MEEAPLSVELQVPDAPSHHWPRLVRSIGATLLGKLWVVLAQLLSVPVLLSVWGAKGYGTWLMLTAGPTYVMLSDIGFGSAAAVYMTQMVARGEKKEALAIFQSTWVLISAILVLVALTTAAAWTEMVPICHALGLTAPSATVSWAFLLLMAYTVVSVEMGVVLIGFRSTKRYARGVFLVDLTIPIETGVLLTVAVVTHSFVCCAAAMLAIRIPALWICYVMLRRDEPWLRFGWANASWSIIRTLVKPALANFAMPLGQAMGMQGVIFTIGLSFGPAAAGIFGAIRAVTRFPMQLASVMSRASENELTIAHALANKPLIARLTGLNLLATIGALAPFMLISPMGDIIMRVISRGRVQIHPELFIAMQAVACLQVITSTLAMLLLAENKLQKVVPWCLFGGFAALAAPLALRGHVSMMVLIGVLGAIELTVMTASGRIWWRESDLAVSDFLELGRAMPSIVSARLASLRSRLSNR